MVKKKERIQREKTILLGLVDLYIKTGKPVGSNTLKENGFSDLSSATLRNYFAKLETDGYLKQQHSSGGRIPTEEAYLHYAQTKYLSSSIDSKTLKKIEPLKVPTREVGGRLHRAAELLCELTGCAVFLSAPRFDQDFITDVKLVGIDTSRCLCVLITDFGLIQTETLYSEKKLSSFSIKRIENYFRFKMTGLDEPTLTHEEKTIADKFYSEVLLRHIVGYTNFSAYDIYKTGFSTLLNYPEFQDVSALASGLGLFEDLAGMRGLLDEAIHHVDLKFWIGNELKNCSVIAMPYFVHQKAVGAFALLGPNRIDYESIFGLMRTFSETLSQGLEESMYKFNISYREPKVPAVLGHVQILSLEDQRRRNE
ncbi:MAG: heat-inducible transcriptional repressor HrcA [Simkaniaceae bacterium]|nr:heat-inducible transcriptional repressor HrcA [Simkaniaceae bacterium]